MGRWSPGFHAACIRLSNLYLALSALACAATLCSFLARFWWLLELSCHFRVQYAAVLVPAVVVAVVRRRFRSAAALGVAAAVNLVVIVPLYFPQSQPDATGHSFRAVLLNVHTANRDSAAVLEFLEESQPDVIVLLEVNARWVQDLRPLRDLYPDSLVEPREDNFGIALFSRIPQTDSRVSWIGTTGVPSIVAQAQVEGRPLTIVATHPLPPVNSSYAADRNRQLASLARLANEQENPVFLLGDLNATSWSPHFADLLRQTDLRDSRKGFGIQPTWPRGSPPLWIPLDHCLVSPSLKVHNRRVGPSVGSDHYPVIVDLEL